MRSRFVSNSVDIVASSYMLVDETFSPVGSGTSFFAFETADFDWLGNAYVGNYDRAAAIQQVPTVASSFGIADVDAAVSFGTVTPDRSVSSLPLSIESAVFAAETAPLLYTSFSDNIAANAFVPFATGFIDFSIYPEFEPVNSLLAVANEGPLAAINQGDMVYHLDEGIGASFVKYAVAETGGLLGGRDPFDPLTYIIGDTDGDGVTDYIIRMDETGPTLMGTDYII